MRVVLVLVLVVLGGCSRPAKVAPLPMAVLIQTQQEADRKSAGCVSCHTATDEPTMHVSKTVMLGCTDCHGGSPEIVLPTGVAKGTRAYDDLTNKAHVQPRYPKVWRGADGRYSSANPKGSYTLLSKEDPAFVRFINPGDLRVARQVCGLCHPSEVNAVERHTMTTTSVFWSAAAYNNGIVAPAIGAQKIPFLGESLSSDGKPRSIIATPPPTPEELANVEELATDGQFRTAAKLDKSPAAWSTASGYDVQGIDEKRTVHAHESDRTQLLAQIAQGRAHQQRSIVRDQLDIVARGPDIFDVAGPHREYAVSGGDVQNRLGLELPQALRRRRCVRSNLSA